MDIRMYKCGFGDCFRISNDKSLYVDFGYLKSQGCPDGKTEGELFEAIMDDISNGDNNEQKDFLLTHYHSDHFNGVVNMLSYQHNVFDNIYIPDVWSIDCAVDVVTLLLLKWILDKSVIKTGLSLFDFLIALCKTNGNIHFVQRGTLIQDGDYIALWPRHESISNFIKRNYDKIIDKSDVEASVIDQLRGIATGMVRITRDIAEAQGNREEAASAYENLYQDYRVLVDDFENTKLPTLLLNRFGNSISIVFQNIDMRLSNLLFTGDVGFGDVWNYIEGNKDGICPMHEFYEIVKIPHHGTKYYYKQFNSNILLVPNFWRNANSKRDYSVCTEYFQDAYEKNQILLFGDSAVDGYITYVPSKRFPRVNVKGYCTDVFL